MTKKCIAVQLPVDLIEKINIQKSKSGQNQGELVAGLIEKGLGITRNEHFTAKLFFFLKVRIDIAKMAEFGQKLQNGEIDNSHTILTYCLKNDPSVGLNFWYAESHDEFNRVLEQYKPYYKEIETTQVITPLQAMKLIKENLSGEKLN